MARPTKRTSGTKKASKKASRAHSPNTHQAELAKLKRAVEAHRRGQRKTAPKFFACNVCVEPVRGTPTVETRFGARCERHLPVHAILDPSAERDGVTARDQFVVSRLHRADVDMAAKCQRPGCGHSRAYHRGRLGDGGCFSMLSGQPCRCEAFVGLVTAEQVAESRKRFAPDPVTGCAFPAVASTAVSGEDREREEAEMRLAEAREVYPPECDGEAPCSAWRERPARSEEERELFLVDHKPSHLPPEERAAGLASDVGELTEQFRSTPPEGFWKIFERVTTEELRALVGRQDAQLAEARAILGRHEADAERLRKLLAERCRVPGAAGRPNPSIKCECGGYDSSHAVKCPRYGRDVSTDLASAEVPDGRPS